MEIEISNKRENSLLKRVEIEFKVIHPKEKCPKRELVREKLAENEKTNKDNIIIDYLNQIRKD